MIIKIRRERWGDHMAHTSDDRVLPLSRPLLGLFHIMDYLLLAPPSGVSGYSAHLVSTQSQPAQALLASIVGYGAGVWAHQLRGDRAKGKLSSLRRKILMRISGAYKTVPTNAWCVTLSVWPLDLEVRKRAAGYWLRKGKLDKVIKLTTNGVSTKYDIRETLLRKWQADWEESITGRRPFQQNQDLRQNRQEETPEEEVTSEDERDGGEETSDLDKTLANW
uniref:Uncharacterized protein n=1 Tax=Timema cristinae TaxID=61476 RepID=A0A7R9CB31_TIMCR|nr:unnamed protein product [Timema cristinae]